MFLGRKKQEQELEEEIASHLRMAGQDLGKDAARRQFGNIGLVKEVTRQMWGWGAAEWIWQDVRYAARVLRRNPGYFLTAALSLALGIGANTAIFSLLDGILFQPLPVKNPHELVALGDPAAVMELNNGMGNVQREFSYPFYKLYREQNRTFSNLYASGRSDDIELKDEAAHPPARLVSNNFFAVLGVNAAPGRLFVESDRDTVVISHDFWQRHYQGAPNAVGKELVVNGATFVVIGVTPKDFLGDVVGEPTDLWFPLESLPKTNPGRTMLTDPQALWLQILGRPKPGVSLAQVATDLNTIGLGILREQARPMWNDQMDTFNKQKLAVQYAPGGFSRMRSNYAKALKMLMALVSLVLLICCANVANLQMARAVKRGREMGLRLAIGAGRWRLIRQLLTESLALALAAGAGAVLAGYWISRLLLSVVAGDERLPLEPGLSQTALLFTAAVSLVSMLAFGLLPAWFATQGDVAGNLKESKMGGAGGAARFFERGLVVFQIVLSVVLLFGSGLFLETLRNLKNADVGFRRDGLVIAELDPWASGYKNDDLNRLARGLVERLRAVPGVTAVSFSENGLFNGTETFDGNIVEGFTARSNEEKINRSDHIGPGYFAAIGTPVLAGRAIDDRDNENAPKVVVINESMERFYFGQRSALGLHVYDYYGKKPLTVIGVVADTKQSGLRDAAGRRFYTPYLQHGDYRLSGLHLEIRSKEQTPEMLKTIGAAIQAFDPHLRQPEIKSAQAWIEAGLERERVIAQLSGFFSFLALALAGVGLYGVMSYLTERRTAEVGVRMALGASQLRVMGMVMREALWMTAAGLVIGTSLAFAIGRLIGTQLYGVKAYDPATALAASGVIAAAAILAAWFPAVRAGRVDPMVALRAE